MLTIFGDEMRRDTKYTSVDSDRDFSKSVHSKLTMYSSVHSNRAIAWASFLFFFSRGNIFTTDQAYPHVHLVAAHKPSRGFFHSCLLKRASSGAKPRFFENLQFWLLCTDLAYYVQIRSYYVHDQNWRILTLEGRYDAPGSSRDRHKWYGHQLVHEGHNPRCRSGFGEFCT